MLPKSVFIIIALCYVPINLAAAKRRFEVELYNITCNNYTSLIKQYDCNLKKIATNLYVINGHGMINRDFGTDGDGHLVIYVKGLKSGDKFIKFLDLKMNVCDGLSQRIPIPLAKDLMDEVRRTSNFPYACPIKGNFLYKFNNFTITDETIPSYAPFLYFIVEMSMYEYGNILGNITVHGATIPRKRN